MLQHLVSAPAASFSASQALSLSVRLGTLMFLCAVVPCVSSSAVLAAAAAAFSAAAAGGRHTMCLAVPVRDASLRRDGSKAGSLASNSRGPSRAASVQGEPISQSQQALLLQLQQQQLLIQQQQEQINRSSGATGSLNTLAAEVAAADGQADQQQQQQFGAGAAALRMSANSRHGSNTGSAVGSPAAATQPPQQQQQQRAGSSLSNASAGRAGNAVSATAGQGHLTGLSHAMSSQSSYSFAPSPGSSILAGGSPGKNNASEQLPSLPFSPSLGQRSGSDLPGMGVEAVHAAAAAAAAVAAQMGGLRVGSPAPGSSGSGSGLSALQQQRQQWSGSGGGLKPGEQVGGLLLALLLAGTQHVSPLFHARHAHLRGLQRCPQLPPLQYGCSTFSK
jgi:hypothetical protein